MKKARTFRFNEAVSKILDSKNNATEFLETLILDSLKTTLTVGEAQILEAIKALNGAVVPTETRTGIVSVPSSKHEILDKIKSYEKERDEKLEFCQDPSEADKIMAHYKNIIDKGWALYNERTDA